MNQEIGDFWKTKQLIIFTKTYLQNEADTGEFSSENLAFLKFMLKQTCLWRSRILRENPQNKVVIESEASKILRENAWNKIATECVEYSFTCKNIFYGISSSE